MGNTWEKTIWAAFKAGDLTRTFRDALLCLAKFRGRGGLIFPSHKAIARRAGCCAKSVERALAAAEGLGFVTWIKRRKRVVWGTEPTSNLYTLIAGNPPKPPDRQGVRQATQENLFFLSAMPEADRHDSLRANAAVLGQRARKIAQEWNAAAPGDRNRSLRFV